ncbi:MAG: four helix bundle suffix domain-containing protein [Candidatus Berkelbacteria bacterium]
MNKVKYLLTYRYSEIIQDLTVEFSKKYVLSYLSNLSNLSGERKPDFRTADQMNQAARSGKQNIVEAVSKDIVSSQGVLKLLGVAKASIEELISDYEDFLRQRELKMWPKSDPRITELKELGYRLSNLSNLGNLGELIEKPELFGNPEQDANFLLTLCHLESFLLDRQIKSVENKFIKEGGYSERLAKKRRDFRGF